MKRFLTGFGLGLAGIAVALGLTLGALAVAGPDVGRPPAPPTFVSPTTPSPSPDRSPGDDVNDDDDRDEPSSGPSASPTETTTVSPSSDDREGDHPAGSEDDHSGSDDEPDDD